MRFKCGSVMAHQYLTRRIIVESNFCSGLAWVDQPYILFLLFIHSDEFSPRRGGRKIAMGGSHDTVTRRVVCFCVAKTLNDRPRRINSRNISSPFLFHIPHRTFVDFTPKPHQTHIAQHALYFWFLVGLVADDLPSESPAGLAPHSNNRSATKLPRQRLSGLSAPRNQLKTIHKGDPSLEHPWHQPWTSSKDPGRCAGRRRRRRRWRWW